jgi:hypothetical protein
MSVVGDRLYFATELGGANYLGGIVAYDVPSEQIVPTLSIARTVEGKLRVHVEGGTIAPSLESAEGPRGPWQAIRVTPTSGSSGWDFEIEPTQVVEFLRAAAAP